MSNPYRFPDGEGTEWIITQEEMKEKLDYLRDNVYVEDEKLYILVKDIIKVMPKGHPMIKYWEGVLNE